MNLNKALVVDDSKVGRVVLKRMLEARGLEVDLAASGQEALDYVSKITPDVVFMDFLMEGMDGYEATRRLRSDARTTAIPVIMCTGNDTSQDRARAKECGVDAFITKPIGDATLDTILGELRQRTAAAEEAAGAVPASLEDAVRAAEAVARQTAEQFLREAIDALTAASERASRESAETVAGEIADRAVDVWRDEYQRADEVARAAAVASAREAARFAIEEALFAVHAARETLEKSLDQRTQAALADATAAAQRVARETADVARAEIEAQSHAALAQAREALDAQARISADELARVAAQSAAHPSAAAPAAIFDAAAVRPMVEETVRAALAAAHHSEHEVAAETERRAVEAAQSAARAEVTRALERSSADRAAMAAEFDAVLRQAMASVEPTAERVARESASAHAAQDEALRAALASARGEAAQAARAAAEEIARSAAESTARDIARAQVEDAHTQYVTAANERDAALRAEVAQIAGSAAERAVEAHFGRWAVEAESARVAAVANVDERIAQALRAAEVSAADATRTMLDAFKAETLEVVQRSVDSMRTELEQTLRAAAQVAADRAADAAARSFTEAAAREAIEHAVREAIASVSGEHAASRLAQEPVVASEAAAPEMLEPAVVPVPPIATEAPRRRGLPTGALVPWLVGLSAGVLYLIVRSFT